MGCYVYLRMSRDRSVFVRMFRPPRVKKFSPHPGHLMKWAKTLSDRHKGEKGLGLSAFL